MTVRTPVGLLGMALIVGVVSSFGREPPRVVMMWSPTMPLSELAVREATVAARDLGLPLTVLQAEHVAEGLAAGAVGDMDPDHLRSALVRAGATVHYPSLVLFDGSEPVGNAIVGHKRAAGYRTLLARRMDARDRGHAPAPVGSPGADARPTDPSADVQVVWRHGLPRSPGAFFRRVPGTRYLAYEVASTVYLRHFESGERFVAPGWIDFVPSPDGALFVTPARFNRGLEFYEATEVIENGRAGRGRDVQPVWLDRQMADQYPSVGILEDRPGEHTDYRILMSWFEGLAFRDYRVSWHRGRVAGVTPLSPKRTACPGLALSLPIMSKDGSEVAARDESTGTTKLLDLADDGSCRELLDLGRQTSKVAFSDDGRLVAFSSPEMPEAGRPTSSRTWVFDRRGEEVTEVPGSESRGLVIPEFVGPDSVLVLVPSGRDRGSVEFRMVCCIR